MALYTDSFTGSGALDGQAVDTANGVWTAEPHYEIIGNRVQSNDSDQMSIATIPVTCAPIAVQAALFRAPSYPGSPGEIVAGGGVYGYGLLAIAFTSNINLNTSIGLYIVHSTTPPFSFAPFDGKATALGPGVVLSADPIVDGDILELVYNQNTETVEVLFRGISRISMSSPCLTERQTAGVLLFGRGSGFAGLVDDIPMDDFEATDTGCPDLTPTDLTAPAIVAPGAPFDVSFVVENLGEDLIITSCNEYFDSLWYKELPGGCDDDGATELDEVLHTTDVLNGASYGGTFTGLTIGSVGTYLLIFKTDVAGEVIEADEDNNYICIEIVVSEDVDPPPGPPPSPGGGVGPACNLDDVCNAIAAGEFDTYIAPDGSVYPLGTVPFKRWVMTMEGTGMPPIEYVTQRGPFQHGETPLSYFLRPRIVQLLIRQQYMSRLGYYNGRYCLLDNIRPNRGNPFLPSATLLNGGRLRPGQLRKVLPDGTTYDLDVLIEQGPKFEPRRSDVWDEFAFSEVLRFVAFDPIFYSPTVESIHCDLAATTSDAQLRFPASFPIQFNSLTSGEEQECSIITYLGNWPEYPTIVVTGPANRPKIQNLTTGELLELVYIIPDGDSVTFDLAYGVKTVTLDSDGTNLIGFLTPESDLGSFHLEPGTNALTLNADGVSLATAIDISWRRRYIGY